MPGRFCARGSLAALTVSLVAAGPAAAQTPYYWNTGLSSGSWDTAATNWSTSAYTTATTQAWSNGNYANFYPYNAGSTTVTVNAAISAAGITASNYPVTINAGSGSLTLAGSNPFLQAYGTTLTVNTAIAGTNGLIISGTNSSGSTPGTVILSGANTYSNSANPAVSTTVNSGGVLQFNSAAAIPSSGTVTVNNGGTVQAGGTLDTATLLGRLTTTSGGAVGLVGSGTTYSTNLNFSAFTGGLSLGASPGSSVTYTGTLTPAANTYQLGGGGGTLTVASNLTDNGSTARSLVVNNGSYGTVVLTGTNSYTGTTTVSGGSLQFNSAASLPAAGQSITVASSGTVAAGGTLDPATLLGRMSTASSGTLGLAGSGTTVTSNLDFSAYTNGLRLAPTAGSTVTYTGTLTPAGNTYRLGGTSGSLAVSSPLVDNGGTARSLIVGLSGQSGGSVTLTGANTYSGPTTMNGGSLYLYGANTYSGPTTLYGGSLYVGNGQMAGMISGNVTFGSYGYLYFNRSDAFSYAGTISGSGNVYQNGSGTLTLSGANTYSGYTYVYNTACTIKLGSDSALGGGSTNTNGLYVYGGTLDLNGHSAGAGYVYAYSYGTGAITNSSSTAATLTVGNGNNSVYLYEAVTGNLALVKAGTGVGYLSSPSNTYTGGTTVSGGTLYVASGAALPGNVALASGTGLSFYYGSTTAAGVISGAGAVSQTGAGYTTTLSGANTYTGGTTVNSGTLQLGAANALPGSGTVILAGGTLSTGATTGYSTTAGPLAVTANSTIALGTGSHTLQFNGISGTPTGTLAITGWTGSAYQSGTGGHLVFYLPGEGSATAANTDYASFLSHVQFSGYGLGQDLFIAYGAAGSHQYECVPTPEPATVGLVAAAGLGVAGWVRRRRAVRVAVAA